MSLPTMGLDIAPGVRWRAFSDGVVVYVGETCETHLLPPDYQSVLNAFSLALDPDASGVGGTSDGAIVVGGRTVAISGAALQELIGLKILDTVN